MAVSMGLIAEIIKMIMPRGQGPRQQWNYYGEQQREQEPRGQWKVGRRKRPMTDWEMYGYLDRPDGGYETYGYEGPPYLEVEEPYLYWEEARQSPFWQQILRTLFGGR